MAIWSATNLSGFNLLDRFDAEYFRPDFLLIESKVQELNSVPLHSYAKYIKRGVQPQYYEDGKIEALRSVNIRNGTISNTRQLYVSEEFFNDNPRGQVGYGDILIASTGVGTLGRVAYNYLDKQMFADGHITIVREVEKRNPQFIALFLQSKIGIAMIERRQRGSSGQIEIYPEDIGSIPIPKLDEEYEEEVARQCEASQQKIEQSKNLYTEAENLLLNELGLDTLDLSHELTYEHNFSDVAAARRFDSDYYQPKYIKLIRRLRQKPHTTLGAISMFSGGATPSGANYLENGIPFLRIQNIGNNHLIMDDVVYINEHIHTKLLKRSQLEPGDVLITITGRIGTAAVVLDDFLLGNINQHIVRARLIDKQTDPYFIAVFLNSVAGRLQTEREAYGTTREALPYYCLEKIIIPTAPKELQMQVKQKVLEADAARMHAYKLLEDAKLRIEQMILGGAASHVA